MNITDDFPGALFVALLLALPSITISAANVASQTHPEIAQHSQHVEKEIYIDAAVEFGAVSLQGELPDLRRFLGHFEQAGGRPISLTTR